MTPHFYFRKVLLPSTLLFIMISCLFSCKKDTNPTEESKLNAQEHNVGKFDHGEKEKDAQFLVNAAEINLEEMEMGKLALRSANDIQIKELGKMMADEHSRCFEGLKTLANNEFITIPLTLTNDSKDAYEKLSVESPADFDLKYCDRLVSGHRSAISAFEKRIKDTKDLQIKKWAGATLKDLKKHLNHALDCQKKMEELASLE